MPVKIYFSSVWVRLSIFPIIQYVGLYVFSLPISLVMIVKIYILCLIIIIKSEVWTITHCLGLGHETMVSAVCRSIFLWFLTQDIMVNGMFSPIFVPNMTALIETVWQQPITRTKADNLPFTITYHIRWFRKVCSVHWYLHHNWIYNVMKLYPCTEDWIYFTPEIPANRIRKENTVWGFTYMILKSNFTQLVDTTCFVKDENSI